LAWLAPVVVAAVVFATTIVLWRYVRQPESEAAQARFEHIVFLAGFAIGLLLALLVWVLNHTRGKALALAAEIEGKYRHPVEAAGAVLYVWHARERRFTYVAPQVEALLGYPASQWTDEAFWIGRVHPEDRDAMLHLTRDLDARRVDRADEYRMIAADGRTVWIRDIVKFDGQPERETVYGIMLDVTEIKRSELALRESEEQFRMAMAHSSIGMALVAPDGRWLRVNRALCVILGYDEAELLALDFQTLTHPDDLDLDLDYVGRMLRREIETYQMAKRYIRKDGSLVWILLNVSLVWDRDGAPRYFISQIQDISDRRAAEQALRESERRFRNLVESANVIPYAWDILAKRYIYVGPQIERLFGQAPGLWTDRSVWLERLHPDDRERILAHSQSFARHPQDTQLEYRIVRPDGAVVWVNDVIKVETGDDGRLIGYGIILDITQARERDAQLQQALKMEAVGQLTSGIAHDFNNLLGIVIGNIDLLLRRLQGRDRPSRGLAEDALSAALLGADITRRLLSFSRRQPMRSELVNLSDLAMQTVALLRHTIGGAIVVRARLARDLWPVEADPAQFESALTNLAINARDAMADGGWLTVRTANRQVTAAEAARDPQLAAGDYVELTVGDTGCGMAADVAERAFDPFFTTKEPGRGSGLGLSMVYGFARQSKGHVAIKSRVGHGTTVSLLLPRAVPDALPADPAPPAERRAVMGSGQTVLVVEDNARMRKTAAAQLAALGYRTVEADSAAKALALLEGAPEIDLLFSDMVMPGGMNGLELAQAARRLRPDIKVLLTSGCTGGLDPAAGRNELLLNKPYRQDELAQMLSKMLRRGRDKAA
jgi:PAS domain S-box-containing protein